MTNTSRIMIVGSGSGCGKTTVTCGLLQALLNKGLKVTSFKCGPDYIDPMFHRKVLGIASRNLDLFMCNPGTVRYLIQKNAKGSDIAVIEGVMGNYDGLSAVSDKCSSNDLAKETGTSQILVVNVKGKSYSLVAEVFGYLNFKQNNIKGVILNNCTEGMYPVFKEMLETNLDIKVYGYLPKIKEATIGSRHLGLVTADEIDDIKEKLNLLGEICGKTLDLDGIIRLANDVETLSYKKVDISPIANEGLRIAVAKDKCFCFYYEDNLSLFKELGAELVEFSPLNDEKLPENIQGLYIGGGYPEEYGEELSKNKSMLKSIKDAIDDGIPTIAECGGYMYLCKTISDRDENKYEVVGAIDSESFMTKKLSRFGYITLTANEDNIMCKKGDQINCHEFHYSDSTNNGDSFTARKLNGKHWDCIHAKKNLFAGYPHFHFWDNIAMVRRFIVACNEYEN